MLNPAELDDFVACSQQENRVPRRIHIPGPVDDHDPGHDVVGGRSFLRAPSVAVRVEDADPLAPIEQSCA